MASASQAPTVFAMQKENYSISQDDYDTLKQTIASLKTRNSTNGIPEYDHNSIPTHWRDENGSGLSTREDLLKNEQAN